MGNFKTFYENIIVDNIDFEGYGISNDSYLYDKIKTLYNIFKKEFVHNNNKHISEITLFADWLQGLPGVLSVPFSYSDILESTLIAGIDVKDKEKFLNDYWINLAKAFFDLKENL